jgi:hypothetical protein
LRPLGLYPKIVSREWVMATFGDDPVVNAMAKGGSAFMEPPFDLCGRG